MNAETKPTAPADAMSPELANKAQEIGQVFNSMQRYLHTLMHEGKMTPELSFASKDLETATFWATRHTLKYGIPAKPAANDDANGSQPSESPEAAPQALPTDNGGTPAENT